VTPDLLEGIPESLQADVHKPERAAGPFIGHERRQVSVVIGISRPTTKSTASSPSLERSGFSPRSIAQRPRRQRRTPTTAQRRTSIKSHRRITMLAKSPTPPTTSYAIRGQYDVRLTNGLACPHCGRVLRATDVEIDDGHAVRVICGGCHGDVLIIGSAS
jgi:hypothetical protein